MCYTMVRAMAYQNPTGKEIDYFSLIALGV
jgi:hypothetical protein